MALTNNRPSSSVPQPETFAVVVMPSAILFVNSSFRPSFVHSAPRHVITTAFRPRFYTSVSKRHCLTDSVRKWAMTSSRPEYDKDNGNVDPSPEDEMLQSELRAKVDELFGSRQNVEIDVSTDMSQAQFTLREPALSRSASSSVADRFRSPKYILTFIAVVSLVTGTFFTALYFTGAVHGLDPSRDNHYEMPTYGKDSYIDPYRLLEQESQNQTPLENPKTDSSVQ